MVDRLYGGWWDDWVKMRQHESLRIAKRFLIDGGSGIGRRGWLRAGLRMMGQVWSDRSLELEDRISWTDKRSRISEDCDYANQVLQLCRKRLFGNRRGASALEIIRRPGLEMVPTSLR